MEIKDVVEKCKGNFVIVWGEKFKFWYFGIIKICVIIIIMFYFGFLNVVFCICI